MQQNAHKLNAFPVFLKLEGAVVVIVGGGEEALAKARLLGQSSARIRIVTEDASPELQAWIGQNGADHINAAYAPEHVRGAAMVVAAGGEALLVGPVAPAAGRHGILVNAADRADLCDFFTPALVNRAPVAVAIGTGGAGPVLAQKIRARIDEMLAPSLGSLA